MVAMYIQLNHLSVLVSCRVYNDNLDVVQVSQGHNETVSSILYIPELKQVCWLVNRWENK